MHPIKVAVIGVGSLGQHHARVYRELGAELVGVADTDRMRAAEIGARYGCPAMTDFRTLLRRVDAVSIAVPTLQHHDVGRACLEAGVHVLLEKPMTATPQEAEDLLGIASARKLTLQIGHIERFNAAFRKALGSAGGIKDPVLIECRRWAPFTSRGADVDVVLDLMIHDLDLALALAGAPVHDVQAHGVAIVSATTDVAHARIVFENGCVAALSASRMAESKIRELRIYQPDGYVIVDLAQRTGRIGRRAMGIAGVAEVLTETIEGDSQEPLKLELQAFLESVATGAPPLVSGREGAAALKLAYDVMARIAGTAHDT
ncbi:MAG: Gfo/Idh/MocA family oxidoreductase [Nitrospirae bacterium]|nr:MAG: Gfo/Idh/MocA family oxidoreductase [Nitrospirota bacterium]